MSVIIDGTSGVNTPNTFAFKNRLINAQLLINQRGVSGTVVLSAGAYGHDRFKAGAGGCTYTFSTSNNVTTLTISAGSLQQVVEGLNLESGTYTLSWTGTAQGKIGAGSYGASGITGSITGGTNTTIEFNTGTLSLPQLEVGSKATSFDYRPYTTELQLCQRYYEKSYAIDVAPGTVTTVGVRQSSNASIFIGASTTRNVILNNAYAVSKRTASNTITLYDPAASNASGKISSYSGAVQYTVSSISGAGASSLGSYIVTSTAPAANEMCVFHFTADAEL